MKTALRNAMFVAAISLAGLVAACGGSSVQGSTYKSEMIKIEFKSGGVAVATIGPMSNQCSYTEKDKQVTVTCDGLPEVFTVAADGTLSSQHFGKLAKA
jgi:hypothetical protein